MNVLALLVTMIASVLSAMPALEKAFYENKSPLMGLPGIYRSTLDHKEERHWGDSFVLMGADADMVAVPLYLGTGMRNAAGSVSIQRGLLAVTNRVVVQEPGQRPVTDVYESEVSFRNGIYDGFLRYSMHYPVELKRNPYAKRMVVKYRKEGFGTLAALGKRTYRGSYVDTQGITHDVSLTVAGEAVRVTVDDRVMTRRPIVGLQGWLQVAASNEDHPYNFKMGIVDADLICAVAEPVSVPAGKKGQKWAFHLTAE